MSSPRRYIPKPMTALPEAPKGDMDVAAGAASTLDVEVLLEQAGTILSREIRNLAIKSTGGKLLPSDARDLVQYIKLLHDIKSNEEEKVASLTDEQLERLAKKE